jgi:hypothetical protein
VELPPYRDAWEDSDPHANFKREVRNYTVADPLPTLEGLSGATGIPVECLVRYILVKWAASCSEALMAMEPVVFQQMQSHIDRAETDDSDTSRLEAYHSLKSMIGWLRTGFQQLSSDQTPE